MSSTSRLDAVYRSLLLTRFFTKGWGKAEHMKTIFSLRRRMADRETALTFVSKDHPVKVDTPIQYKSHQVINGSFVTPAVQLLPGLLPKECQTAHFQMILPAPASAAQPTPMCIQYAGTGDHYFWRRRRLMALPMLKERGVASIIIENPFYGLRKPADQVRSSLQNVTDIFVMGTCLILETLVLFHWCKRNGYWPLVLHGISMGGHMATLGATVCPEPVGVVPCLAWSSASLTFTKGVMTDSIPWSLLVQQLSEVEEAYKICDRKIPENDAFRAGVDFAKIVKSKNSDDPVGPTSPVEETNNNRTPFSNIVNSLNIPFVFTGTQKDVAKDVKTNPHLRDEAIQFMRGIMDECTHLQNFAVPVAPELCIAVSAENDAYQPRDGVRSIPEIWPGSQMRYISGEGHVSSYLFKQKLFRQAIYEVLDKMSLQQSKQNKVVV